jgi:two-component system catabolic regulation response regulator CreB
VLRRLQKQRQGLTISVQRIGQLEVNEMAAHITWCQQPLLLTRYEYLLLKTFLQWPGRVFSRQQLMDLVWSTAEDSFDRTVDTHIKTLRAKLRAINPDLSPINTHRGLGYSLGVS